MLSLSSCAPLLLALALPTRGEPPPKRLTFRDVIKLSLRHNESLVKAGLDLQAARQGVRSARGEYDTALGANVAYTRTKNEEVPEVNYQTLESATLTYGVSASQKLPTGGSVSLELGTRMTDSLTRFSFGGTPIDNDTTVWDTSLTLSVTHPLLKGIGLDSNLAALRQARLTRDAARWTVLATARIVVRDLLKAYLDLVESEAAVSIRREALTQARRDLKQALALVKVGRQAEAELVDYRLAVAQRERELLEARTLWLQRSLTLRTLMGVPVKVGPQLISARLPGKPFGSGTPTASEATQAAVRSSADLVAALKQLRIKEISLVKARRDTWPSLELSAQVGPTGRSSSAGRAYEGMFKFKSLTWSVGLTFSYLVQNRAARANREQARLEVSRQKVTIHQLRQRLKAEALTTHALLLQEQRLVHVTGLEQQLAAQRLDNERKKYAAGRSNLFILLQMQTEEIQSRYKVLAARIAHLKRRTELAALMGDLLHRFHLEQARTGAIHRRAR